LQSNILLTFELTKVNIHQQADKAVRKKISKTVDVICVPDETVIDLFLDSLAPPAESEVDKHGGHEDQPDRQNVNDVKVPP
jgi:hypothetical protein